MFGGMIEPVPQVARVPTRLVILSVAGLWLCYFVVATLRSGVMGLDFSGAMVARRLVVVAGSMLVTLALWPLLRVTARRPLWLTAAAVCLAALPGSVLLAGINQLVFADMAKAAWAGADTRNDGRSEDILDDPATKAPIFHEKSPKLTPWEEIADLALGRYFLLLAWAAIYLALANAEQVRAAERREGEFRRAAQAAELRSLRYQINPHFLFNTLNSLSALVLTGKSAAAERMIQTLSAFYRRSLTGDPTEDLALGDEFALQTLYLEIEAVRFPERLRTRIDLPDALAGVPVPGMILQPLVENSVKYGVAASRTPVTIAITAAVDGAMLVLTVSDDGAAGAAVKPDGCGIGLANVRDRLHARFDGAASVDSQARPTGGHATVIRLPLRGARG